MKICHFGIKNCQNSSGQRALPLPHIPLHMGLGMGPSLHLTLMPHSLSRPAPQNATLGYTYDNDKIIIHT